MSIIKETTNPIGIPSGWEWIAAHDYDKEWGIESVTDFLPYLVNSELLDWGEGNWIEIDITAP